MFFTVLWSANGMSKRVVCAVLGLACVGFLLPETLAQKGGHRRRKPYIIETLQCHKLASTTVSASGYFETWLICNMCFPNFEIHSYLGIVLLP